MDDQLEPGEKIEHPHGRVFRTKRRLVIAVLLLIVVAVAIDVVTNAVKTHRDLRASYVGVTKIDARVEDGSVKLVSSNSNTVDVDRKENYTLRGPSITEKVQDGTLIIHAKCSGLHVGECTTSYVISVPGNVMTNAATTSGSITADGLHGGLDLMTAGGKVTGAQLFGDVSIATQTGKVVCDDISAPRATVTSKSGAVNLNFSVEPVNVDANSNDGDVSITVPKTNATYNVDAVSANKRSTVDVRVDASSPRQIKAHSENGTVSVTR